MLSWEAVFSRKLLHSANIASKVLTPRLTIFGVLTDLSSVATYALQQDCVLILALPVNNRQLYYVEAVELKIHFNTM